MRFIWEEDDIQPGWRVVSTGNTECIIGYRYDNQNKGEQRITLISLDDGLLITEYGLKTLKAHNHAKGSTMLVGVEEETITARAQMALFLNDGAYKPKTLTRFG